ncbi:hypothetical protein [Pseudoalteromonas sp. Z9A6]|uniref:hypothetical protein n=1 Tax=Pseudoalteromonas sp. Z9A6 TaxID=2686352 RepID=UPI0013FE0EDA|nr:hypothetical protein [Pseudoalteromonas sp. Z9A6]
MATGNVSAGDVFNNWTVLSDNKRDEKGEQYFMCICVCGIQRSVRKGNLGKTTGCGCVRKSYQASNIPRKPKSKAPLAVKKAATNKKNSAPAYAERTKSPREKLEDRLEQHRLEREISEMCGIA